MVVCVCVCVCLATSGQSRPFLTALAADSPSEAEVPDGPRQHERLRFALFVSGPFESELCQGSPYNARTPSGTLLVVIIIVVVRALAVMLVIVMMIMIVRGRGGGRSVCF